MSLYPKQLARMLQNRAVNVKAVQHVTALQDTMDNVTGTCFYVHDDDGAILRVAVTEYKKGLR